MISAGDSYNHNVGEYCEVLDAMLEVSRDHKWLWKYVHTGGVTLINKTSSFSCRDVSMQN